MDFHSFDPKDPPTDFVFQPRKSIHGRNFFVSSSSRVKPNRYIVLPFSTVLLDGINPLLILHKAIISGKSDICKQLATTFSKQDIKLQYGIAWQYPSKPLSLTLCNAKSVNNEIKAKEVTRCKCSCAKAYPHLIDPAIGHVRGMGPKLTSNTQSQRVISKGLNFRPSPALNVTDAMEVTTLLWGKAENYVLKLYGGDENETCKAKKRFLSYCRAALNLECKRASKVTSHGTYDEKSLEFAQNVLAITKVDKAAHTIAWECKRFHQLTLWERATQGSNFKRLCEPPLAIKATLITLVAKNTYLWLKPQLIPQELAYLASTIKFHKDPIAYRFLTPMHNCPIAPISKLIAASTQHLLTSTWAELCHQGELHILNTHGVRTRLNWKVSSMNEYMLNLPNTVSSLWGCDIDQCYEKPPLFGENNSLCSAIEFFLRECFQFECDKAGCIQHLWFKTKRGKTVKDDDFVTILGFSKCNPCPKSKQVHKLKLDYLLRLVRVLLSNLIIQVGDTTFKQLIGFPMGCHPSSDFCDIWFGVKEYNFIWRCICAKQFEIASRFEHPLRYQDDVSILNNHLAMQHFDLTQPQLWIYPMDLIAIKDTTINHATINGRRIGVEMTFLSARLTLTQETDGSMTLHTKRYEKVRELPFATTKFTHRASCVPSNSLYNIIGSQLSMNAIVSSHLEYFLEEVHVLIKHLINNALIMRRVKHTITQWAENKAHTLPLNFAVNDMQERLSNILATY